MSITPAFFRLLAWALFAWLFLPHQTSAQQCPPPASCTPGAAPAANLAFGMGIFRVQLAGLDTATNGAADGYRDYSCQARTAQLVRGGTYTLRVTTNPNADETLRAWLDLNNDGIFTAAEQIAASTGRQHAVTFTVPATAALNTPLRLRLAADYALAPVPTACSTPQYSQTEDYRVRLSSSFVAPGAAFAAADTVSCSGTVAFTDLSTNSPATWRWTFGDGTTSTQQHPTHTYAAPGRYAVRLRVCNPAGCDSLTRAGYVLVRADAPKPAPCQPATVAACCNYGITRLQLANLNWPSATGAAGYEDFACAARATLTADRSYPLQLTTGGTQPHDVRVYLDLNDDGQFSASELLASALAATNPTLQLTVPSTTTGLVYQRPLRLRLVSDFGGSAATGPCSAPQNGQVEDYSVVVVPNAARPTASFSFAYQRLCGPVEVTLTNTTTGGAISYNWDFGDGTTSTLASPPVHTYTASGVYDIRLIASNSYGADTTWQQVVAAVACPTYCQAYGVGGSASAPVYFTRVNLADIDNLAPRGPGVAYRDFRYLQTNLRCGQSYTLQLESPVWTFAGSGPWVRVSAWIDFNQDGSFSPDELIGQRPGNSLHSFLVSIPLRAKPGATRMRVQISSVSQGVYLNACPPANQNVSTEDYSVIMLPNQAPPTAGFRADLTSVCNGSVQFRDTTYAGPTNWQWTFGDGSTSTQQNPQHRYAQPGTYSIKLRVRNRFGVDSVTRANYVTVTALNTGPRLAACLPPGGVTGGNRAIGNFFIGTAFRYYQFPNAPGYRDETCTFPALVAQMGVTYPMVLANFYSPGADVFIWLDANDDGIFDSQTELLYNSLAYPPTPSTRNTTFTLPSGTVLNQPLRMRAYFWGLTTSELNSTVPDPCTRELFTGQVRDFTVLATSSTTAVNSGTQPSAFWQAYPNPSTGLITLTGTARATALEIWDSTGRLLRTQPLQPGAPDTQTANLHDLPKGLYVLRLRGLPGSQRLVLQ